MEDDVAWERKYQGHNRVWSGRHNPQPDIPSGLHVLDLGCGDGKSVPERVRRRGITVAIDISQAAARLSHAAAHRSEGDGIVEVLAADARRLPFMRGIFGAVIAHHILGHLDYEGRQRAADDIARVLGPGGRLYFVEFSCEDFRYGKGTMTEPGTYLRGDGISTHYFCDDEVPALFSAFNAVDIGKTEWNLRVSGKWYPRCEISAVFAKRDE
jgi:SAM-dependent methyltransferase